MKLERGHESKVIFLVITQVMMIIMDTIFIFHFGVIFGVNSFFYTFTIMNVAMRMAIIIIIYYVFSLVRI